MSPLTVLLATMTVIMTAVMVPRTYWARLRAEAFHAEGELRKLRLLLAQQNQWVMLHLGCGIVVVSMIWLLLRFVPEVPESATAVLALYAATAFLFAVIESLLAQKIERLSS